MDRWLKSLLVGVSLLVAFALGMMVLAAAWHLNRTYRHVVVEVDNVNDVGRVNVDCRRAIKVTGDEGPQTIDLGYLSPDDRIALSAFNEIGDASWGFRVVSNGRTVFDQERGRARAAGFPADEYAVVMAKSITADGDLLGTIGCDPPLVVSPALVSYHQSADNLTAEKNGNVRQPWQAPTSPFALIETMADWTLPLLALIGFAAALATPEVRALARRHWRISLAIAGVNLLLNLSRQFGVDGLILSVELFGAGVLLFFAAAVNLWTGLVLGGVLAFSGPRRDDH